MNDFDLLIRLIIPVLLLVFWALSNLLNRDNTPKDAQGRATPLGPRPSQQAGRPSNQDRLAGAPTMTPPRGSARDEVLIIRAEPTPRNVPPNRRNAGRSRREPNPAPRRQPEPQPSRNRELVGGKISADVNQTLSNSIDLAPLSRPVGLVDNDAATVSQIGPRNMPASDLRSILTDPQRVREAFLLNELLGPPVSQRKRSRG